MIAVKLRVIWLLLRVPQFLGSYRNGLINCLGRVARMILTVCEQLRPELTTLMVLFNSIKVTWQRTVTAEDKTSWQRIVKILSVWSAHGLTNGLSIVSWVTIWQIWFCARTIGIAIRGWNFRNYLMPVWSPYCGARYLIKYRNRLARWMTVHCNKKFLKMDERFYYKVVQKERNFKASLSDLISQL